jgi:hypothetical protein
MSTSGPTPDPTPASTPDPAPDALLAQQVVARRDLREAIRQQAVAVRLQRGMTPPAASENLQAVYDRKKADLADVLLEIEDLELVLQDARDRENVLHAELDQLESQQPGLNAEGRPQSSDAAGHPVVPGMRHASRRHDKSRTSGLVAKTKARLDKLNDRIEGKSKGES